VHQIDHDPVVTAYGREAALALGVDPGRVFKTLVCSVGARLVVAVVPVTGELDLKEVAAALGAKSAEMADPSVAQRTTGYVVGGISPVGQKRRLRTLLDESATGWETIFVSGGRRGLELELAPADLLAVTGGQVASIGKPRGLK
jgi:Cys-tRNA(Pro)/Cys-tRNA(Cys) deacylase